MTSSNYLKFLVFVIYSCLTVSCEKPAINQVPEEKQPTADFSFDKSEYIAGDTVILTNKSLEAFSYRWTLPDGTTSKTEHFKYLTTENGLEQTLSFKLEVFSESGKKTDLSVKNTKVKPLFGRLVIYDGYYTGDITIRIDGATVGVVRLPEYNKFNPAPPPVCGQAGYPTYDLTVGNHVLNAICPAYNTTHTVVIKANQCSVLRIN